MAMKARPLNRLKRLFGINSARKTLQLPEEKGDGSFKVREGTGHVGRVKWGNSMKAFLSSRDSS